MAFDDRALRLLENTERILTTGWSGRDAFGIDYGDGKALTLSNPLAGLTAKLDAMSAAIDAQTAQLRAGIVADVVTALTPLLESGPVSREDLVAALTAVLGSVDGATPAAGGTGA